MRKFLEEWRRHDPWSLFPLLAALVLPFGWVFLLLHPEPRRATARAVRQLTSRAGERGVSLVGLLVGFSLLAVGLAGVAGVLAR